MRVDIQLNPATTPLDVLLAGAQAAEAAGFDACWVFDHYDGTVLPRDGAVLAPTMLDCFTLLGGLAVATSRIALGTLVVNVANRVPSVMVQCAASVQVMSSGRLLLGIGAGASPGSPWAVEHARLGIELGATMADRHARVVRAIDEMDRFWSPDRDPALAGFTLPDPRPPVIIGVNSVALAALAGRRSDGINVRGDHPRLAEIVDAATAARADAGRGADGFEVSVWARWDEALLRADHPDRRRWAELGVERLILVPLRGIDVDTIVAAGALLGR